MVQWYFTITALVCHSLEPGENGYGPSLAEYFKRNFSQTAVQTEQLVRSGRRRMPPFQDRLSSEEIQGIHQNLVNARPSEFQSFPEIAKSFGHSLGVTGNQE
jgi:mono/diheme cytochrome c family protein